MRRLILFDVDGTLVSTGGRAGRALARALDETFGCRVSIEGYSFCGKTDPQIVLELLARNGHEAPEARRRLPEVIERYLGHLEELLVPGSVTVLPGVPPLLAELGARADVAVGLLTGNVRDGARLKLERVALWQLFPFGAFGSDEENRDALVEVARQRAGHHWGQEFPAEQTVVLGDAEADVRCARAGGARAVAVATGGTPSSVLARLQPDALLDSLLSPATLPALLGSAA